jgi:hypothetical protein
MSMNPSSNADCAATMTKQEAAVSEKDKGTDEAFLSRWSRKKNESRTEEMAAVTPAATPLPTPAPLPELPDVETLTAQSDFSVFMGKDVPDEMRFKALRKLWASDPIYNTTDGLDLYTDDRSFLPPLPEEAVAALKKALWGEEPSPPATSEEGVDGADSTVYTSGNRETEIKEKSVAGEALSDAKQAESDFGGGGSAESRPLELTCESPGQSAKLRDPENSRQS